MKNLNDFIQKSLALSARTQRYHAHPTIHKQSIGEHSHRVATLYVELWGLPSAEILYYILHHDSGEFYAGDTPFGAKRENLDLKTAVNSAESIGLEKLGIKLPNINYEEFVKIKLSDILEMNEFGWYEILMGNILATPIIQKTKEAVSVIAKDFPDLEEKALVYLGQKTIEFTSVIR